MHPNARHPCTPSVHPAGCLPARPPSNFFLFFLGPTAAHVLQSFSARPSLIGRLPRALAPALPYIGSFRWPAAAVASGRAGLQRRAWQRWLNRTCHPLVLFPLTHFIGASSRNFFPPPKHQSVPSLAFDSAHPSDPEQQRPSPLYQQWSRTPVNSRVLGKGARERQQLRTDEGWGQPALKLAHPAVDSTVAPPCSPARSHVCPPPTLDSIVVYTTPSVWTSASAVKWDPEETGTKIDGRPQGWPATDAASVAQRPVTRDILS